MKLIIDIDEKSYNNLKIGCTQRVSDSEMIEALKNGTPIPDNATNGDVAEKVFGKDVYCTLIRMMYSSCCEKLKDWWNALYQKGGNVE